MKSKTLIALTFSILSISCLSTASAKDEQVQNETPKIMEQENTSDKIYGYSFTQSNSKVFPGNRLMAIGDKFVYVTNIKPQNTLIEALQTEKLSKPFTLTTQSNHLIVDFGESDGSFTAYSEEDNNAEEILCLSYQFNQDTNLTTQKSDITQLKKLGFKSISENYYMRCYGKVYGRRFPISSKSTIQYHFKEPVEVEFNRRYNLR